MIGSFAEINGHQVVDLPRLSTQGRFGSGPVCIRCDAHFVDRLEVEESRCPVADQARGHDLLVDPDDGLLYCTRCPLVAYDLADVGSEPPCPGHLRP
ncbi:hypothetical protein Kfla_1946 [Kribbella flavida DSM 17836]|uniref:Uncharacterized protein n=1 Tax=Kribbella flavida (strain DSM 17836 / JCM 10339 / NBRC 14399) TaxID=479435 RepID=D2PQQ7_KRIFD|nr:hypothetical protein [Kribbella flavida]ADB31040.1 hypothetical protein Kfla_1946 [Kribbella flavida DSM 17836]